MCGPGLLWPLGSRVGWCVALAANRAACRGVWAAGATTAKNMALITWGMPPIMPINSKAQVAKPHVADGLGECGSFKVAGVSVDVMKPRIDNAVSCLFASFKAGELLSVRDV